MVFSSNDMKCYGIKVNTFFTRVNASWFFRKHFGIRFNEIIIKVYVHLMYFSIPIHLIQINCTLVYYHSTNAG